MRLESREIHQNITTFVTLMLAHIFKTSRVYTGPSVYVAQLPFI